MNKIGLLTNLLSENSNANAAQTWLNMNNSSSISQQSHNLYQGSDNSLNEANTLLLNQLKLNYMNNNSNQQLLDLNNNSVSTAKLKPVNSSAHLQQQELVKRILEKNKMHEKQQQLVHLQQQQIKLINGHLQQVVEQTSQTSSVNKEYILSQLRMQQKQQELAKKQQFQQYQQEILIKQQKVGSGESHFNLMSPPPPLPQLQTSKIESSVHFKPAAIQEPSLEQLLTKIPNAGASKLTTSVIARPKVFSPPPVLQQQNLESTLLSSTLSQLEMNASSGSVKNIPPNLMLDQFGMLGLLMALKQGLLNPRTDQEKNVKMLFSMSEAFNSENALLERYEERMPAEYRISANAYMREKLCAVENVIEQSGNDDLLFYLFYVCNKSELQQRAYDLLTSRSWIYDTKFKLWLKSAPPETSESAKHYQIFDPKLWSIRVVNLSDINKAQ